MSDLINRDDALMCATGERTGKTYKIGEEYSITVLDANPELLRIDYIFTKDMKGQKKKWNSR